MQRVEAVAGVAGERKAHLRIEKVRGSNPLSSTEKPGPDLRGRRSSPVSSRNPYNRCASLQRAQWRVRRESGASQDWNAVQAARFDMRGGRERR